MIILKSKIKHHIEKAKIKERGRIEKEHEAVVNEIEREHRKKLKRIHDKYQSDINDKNYELKMARRAWDRYRDKVAELSELIFKLRNFTKLCEINTLELFKYASSIQEGVERAERFITNNEAKINYMLAMEKVEEE